MAANIATVSAGSCLLDRRRNRRDTSSRGMTPSPQDRQIDTAFVDQADWKLSLGPTCALQLVACLPCNASLTCVERTCVRCWEAGISFHILVMRSVCWPAYRN